MSRAALLAKKQAETVALAGTPAAAPVVAADATAAPVATAPPAGAQSATAAPTASAPAVAEIPSLLPAPLADEPLWDDSAAPAPPPAAPAYDVSAIVAQANELATIKAQHEAAMREIADLRKQAAAPVSAATRKAAKDIITAEQWKSENVDHAVAVDLLDGFSPAIEAMIEERVRAATAPVAEQLAAQQTRTVEQLQRQFEHAVIERVPHMQRILDDKRFSVFLSKPMPGAGLPYAEAFNRHVADKNPDGMAWVAQQFAAYTRAGAPASAAVAPASTAAEPPPARGGATLQTQLPAAEEAPVTLEEFAQLKRDLVQHRISRTEFATKSAALRQRALSTGSPAGVH